MRSQDEADHRRGTVDESSAGTVVYREQTVRECLDGRIKQAYARLKSLEDLKNSLTQSYLDSPASRLPRTVIVEG